MKIDFSEFIKHGLDHYTLETVGLTTRGLLDPLKHWQKTRNDLVSAAANTRIARCIADGESEGKFYLPPYPVTLAVDEKYEYATTDDGEVYIRWSVDPRQKVCALRAFMVENNLTVQNLKDMTYVIEN